MGLEAEVEPEAERELGGRGGKRKPKTQPDSASRNCSKPEFSRLGVFEREAEMNVVELMEKCGFECLGQCAASDLHLRPEVRDMCAADICQSYDANWSCPPACGSLEEFQAIIDGKTTCYVAQTVGELEDSFDFESMMDAEQLQSQRFVLLQEMLHAESDGNEAFVLGSGTCTVCPKCSYPDSPCRFPHLRMVSMEAAGLVVSEVCVTAGVPYNHGPNTVSYTGCVLV